MANYVFAYSGGKGVAAEEAERRAQMARWGRWFEELGSAVIDGGAATGTAKTVGPAGWSATAAPVASAATRSCRPTASMRPSRREGLPGA